MAAMTASYASANIADFNRPPVFSSPRLRRKCFPKPSRCATVQSEAAFTKRARLFESWPSLQSGNVRTSSSLTSNSSTASPRNSSFSLSPGESSAVRSGMRELWVRACKCHRGSRNSCPRTNSSSASSPTAIGITSLPAHLCRGIFLGSFRTSLALRDQRAARRTLLVGGHGIVVVTGLHVRVAKQVVVDRIRGRGQMDCLRKFSPRVLVFLVLNVDQSQPAVSHRQLVILRFLERGVINRVGLRQVRNQLDGVLGIGRGCLDAARHGHGKERENVNIIRIEFDRLGTRDEHLVLLTFSIIGSGQLRIDAHQIVALRVFGDEVFCKLNLSCRAPRASRVQRFVSFLFRLIDRGGFCGTRCWSLRCTLGRLGRLRRYRLTAAVLCLRNSRPDGNSSYKGKQCDRRFEKLCLHI